MRPIQPGLGSFRDFIRFKEVLYFSYVTGLGKFFCMISTDCLCQKLNINRIIQHTVFCNLLVSLSTVFSGHNVVCVHR